MSTLWEVHRTYLAIFNSGTKFTIVWVAPEQFLLKWMPLKQKKTTQYLLFILQIWNCHSLKILFPCHFPPLFLTRLKIFTFLNLITFIKFIYFITHVLSLEIPLLSLSPFQSHSSSSRLGLSSLGGSWNLMFASMSLIATIRRFTSWFNSWPAWANSMSSSSLGPPFTRE